MTKEEKAHELSQKYCPIETSTLLHPYYEAGACEQACLEMADWQHEIDCRRYAHVPLKEVKDAWQTLRENDPDVANMPAVCFQKGVDWEKEQMIDKAVEWLIINANDYIINDKEDYGRDWLKIKSEMFDDFKKAMEG